MGKTIVFCADGTWNGPSENGSGQEGSSGTNVFKLFLDLAGKDSPDTVALGNEQERSFVDANGAVLQSSKYINGVGDSDNFLVKLMGGTVGAGVIIRIIRGYTFISRNYLAGDRIVINGFSRGAYTARALAAFIADKGLLDATQIDLTQKENAYRIASAVWYDYRKTVLQPKAGFFAKLEGIVADLPGFFSAPPTSQLVDAAITAVAVWDTVGSLGIPEYAAQDGGQMDTFRFADSGLSTKVSFGFHAISVDEQRGDFEPTLWDDRSGITQTLFPGAHADVGGGYPASNNECGLSDIAFNWMKSKLVPLGVQFSTPLATSAHPDPLGVAHQPWNAPPWNLLPLIHRNLPAGLCLHPSVSERISEGPTRPDPAQEPGNYQPTNLAAYLDAAGSPLSGVALDS